MDLRISTRIKEGEPRALERAHDFALKAYKEWKTPAERALEDTRMEDIAVVIIQRYEKDPSQKKTYRAAKNQFKHLLKFFRHKRMLDIANKPNWDAYVRYCQTESENPDRNLNDDHKYFIMACLHAYHMGIRIAPLSSKTIPKPDLTGDIGREISKDEEKLILENSNPELNFQIRTALTLGWRLREMLQTKWSYIDWERNAISLPPSVTKTRKGREFPVPSDLMSEFKARFLASQSPYVWPSPQTPFRWVYDNKTAWQGLLRRVKINCRWHDLRHTCATRMLRAGVSRDVIGKLLGMTKKVLNRIYDHLNVDDYRHATDATGKQLGKGYLNAGKTETN